MIRKDGFINGFSAALGIIAALLLLYVTGRFAEALLGIATPFIAAFAIALLLDPLVTRLQKNPVFHKRFWAVLVVFLLFLLGFAALMTYLVPSLIDQTQRLVRWFTPVTYKIKQGTKSSGPFRTVASEVAATKYTVKGLNNGEEYFFTVYAQSTGTADDASIDVELPIGPVVSVTAGAKNKPGSNASLLPKTADPVQMPSGSVTSGDAASDAPVPGQIEALPGDTQITLTWQPPPESESGFDRFREKADDWLADHKKIGMVTLPANVEGLIRQYSDQTSQTLKLSASRLASLVLASASKLIYVILIPIITFYLLLDLDRIGSRSLFLLPDRMREPARKMTADVGGVFGSYVRGMLTVSLIYGVVAIGVFFGCGLKTYAILLGVAAGLLYTIPFVGPLATSLLAALVSLALGHDAAQTGWTLAAAFAQNQVFDNFVVPRVVGHSVGLHPLVTLAALFIGGEMFGIWGMLLSVPTTASIQVVLFRLFPKLAAPTPISNLMKKDKNEPLPGANPDAETRNENVSPHQPVA